MVRSFGTSIFILLFLGTMFGGLFHMTMNMDMTARMTNCPFAVDSEVICTMNVSDHIGAWKSVFLSTVSALTMLLAVAGVAVFITSAAPNLLRKIDYTPLPLLRWLEIRTYSFSYRPLQELFSSGILHPKLF